jgi:hypothetical protein
VRILHARGYKICPFADAEAMHGALGAGVGAKRELIVYEDADYGESPFPQRHPGPHHLRPKNVFACVGASKRAIPASIERVIRYKQQGHEGTWSVDPPEAPTKPLKVTLTESKGRLAAAGADATYLVPLADFVAKKKYTVGTITMGTKADMAAAMSSFKKTGDPARVHAAAIFVQKSR